MKFLQSTILLFLLSVLTLTVSALEEEVEADAIDNDFGWNRHKNVTCEPHPSCISSNVTLEDLHRATEIFSQNLTSLIETLNGTDAKDRVKIIEIRRSAVRDFDRYLTVGRSTEYKCVLNKCGRQLIILRHLIRGRGHRIIIPFLRPGHHDGGRFEKKRLCGLLRISNRIAQVILASVSKV